MKNRTQNIARLNLTNKSNLLVAGSFGVNLISDTNIESKQDRRVHGF